MTGAREGDYASKKYAAPLPPRPLSEIETARVRIAELALTTEDPEAWLRDVLEALALDVKGLNESRQWVEPCWPFAGTKRGYTIHLHSYTTMCDPCQKVRDEERATMRSKVGEQA